jgi:hypothetical protein
MFDMVVFFLGHVFLRFAVFFFYFCKKQEPIGSSAAVRNTSDSVVFQKIL